MHLTSTPVANDALRGRNHPDGVKRLEMHLPYTPVAQRLMPQSSAFQQTIALCLCRPACAYFQLGYNACILFCTALL